MAVTKRKCKKCKGTIEIDKSNITGVVYYDNFYYHEQCFCDLCTQKIEKKRGGWTKWQAALDNLWQIKADTKQRIQQSRVKTDPLNDYLLEHYDVTAVPKNFWTAVADLDNGIYRSKRCKPVDIDTLLEAWKWGQGKLDEINMYNKSHKKGPIDDNTRLTYDLAILVNKMPRFIEYKKKHQAATEELAEVSSVNDIDMSRVGQNKYEARRDMSDISDDLFVE